jgi:hypothetical protein
MEITPGALEQNRKTCTQMSNQARIQKGLAVAVLSSSCTHLGTSESEFFVVSSIWSERLKLQIVMPVRCCFGTSQDLMLHDVPVMTLFDARITVTYSVHQNVTCSSRIWPCLMLSGAFVLYVQLGIHAVVHRELDQV